MNIDHNDINYYRPNETSPMIVNPDKGSLKSTEAADRTNPPDLKVTGVTEAGIGQDSEFTLTERNDNAIGDRTQPAVHFHLQSVKEIAPNEVFSLTIRNIEVPGKEGEERTGKLLVQHDANEGNWVKTAAQGRVSIPLSANPESTHVAYPAESSSDYLKKLLPQKASLLKYAVRGKGGTPINAGIRNNLELLVTNPHPKKSVYVAHLALLAKVGVGQDSLCSVQAAKEVEIRLNTSTNKGFRVKNNKQVAAALMEQRKQGKTWTIIGEVSSEIGHKPPRYTKLEPGKSFTFAVPGVKVSPTSGEAPFMVLEYSSLDETKKITYTEHRQIEGKFTKMGAGFFFDYLSTDQPEIQKGNKARLVWSAENVKKYKVYSTEKEGEPEGGLDIKPGDQDKDTGQLNESTVYLLEAFSREGISFTRQTVAAVHEPSSTFRHVAVKGELNLNQTAYRNPIKITYDSNTDSWQEKEIVKPSPTSTSHEGDRFVVVGISEDKLTYTAEGKSPSFDLFLRSSSGDSPAGTLFVDPLTRNTVGLRLPPETTLIAKANVTTNKSIKVTLIAITTDPRTLPPFPYRK